jgi:hypothetical protein
MSLATGGLPVERPPLIEAAVAAILRSPVQAHDLDWAAGPYAQDHMAGHRDGTEIQ